MDESFDDIFDRKVEANSEANDAVEITPEAPIETPEVATETTTEEAPAKVATEVQPRDEQGRFTPRVDMVPHSALHAARQKAQAEAQRAAELEQRLQEYEDAKRQNERPDPFEQPDDYDRHVQELVQRQVAQQLRQIEAQRQQQLIQEQTKGLFDNLTAVVKNYPEEVAKEALDYGVAQSSVDDEWGQECLRQADPIKAFLDHKNRHAQELADLEELRRDRAAFIAREAALLGFGGASSATANQPQMAAAADAPTSLASAGSGFVSPPTTQTMSEAFDAIFDSKKR